MRKFELILIISLVTLLAALSQAQPVASQEEAFDWKSDWAVEKGFTLSIDTEGYTLPTAIAFVPNPGPEPKDPLYFVTELGGKVKVVTNDRTVYTFAENFFRRQVERELPAGKGESGLAGICLEPKHGYVFVTFAYPDQDGVLRNNIVRFQTEPETFSIKPTDQVAFTEVFAAHRTGYAHQIGPCQIKDDLLYVSVGEGWQSSLAQDLDAMVGKLIRMTLNGQPVPENPFYEDNDVKKTANYVWAYGLRNPFGLKIVKDRFFVADNGVNIDRFLEVYEGENYLWNGNDWSIATKAVFVFVPSLAPAQMDYYPKGSVIFPEEYQDTFFVAVSGYFREKKVKTKTPGIIMLKYGLEEKEMLEVPRYFLKFRGDDSQILAGLAFGSDGLYFTPILPNREGLSAVFKVTYDPASQYPYNMAKNDNPAALIAEKGCLGCHSLERQGGGGVVGPALDREEMVARIQTKLNSPEYRQQVAEIDQMDTEPFVSFKKARQEVAQAKDLEQVEIWMKYRLLEPRFDDPNSQMPNLGLNEIEAQLITDYLLETESQELTQTRTGLRAWLIRLGNNVVFVAVFAAGFVFAFASIWSWKFRRKLGRKATPVG